MAVSQLSCSINVASEPARRLPTQLVVNVATHAEVVLNMLMSSQHIAQFLWVREQRNAVSDLILNMLP